MKTKHTPGPWRILGSKLNEHGVTVNEIGAIRARGLADIYEPNDKDFEPDYIHGSNSRLIASAPELLELAFKFKADLLNMLHQTPARDNRIAQIDEVINKALGL